MSWTTVQSNGSPTALTVSSATTLESPSITTSATYVLELDTTNLANGDALEIRIKKKGPGGTLMGAYFASYANAQGSDEVLKLSVPVPLEPSSQISFVLTQTAGTGRVVPWLIKSA